MSKQFAEVMARYSIPADTQVELLLDYIGGVADESFERFVTELDEVLADETKQEVEMPVEHTSDADAFFDRNLALRHTQILTELKAAANKAGEFLLTPDPDELQGLQDILDDGTTLTTVGDMVFKHGEILGGWYCTLPAGTVMIMVVNGDANGGPFVDALLVLPPDAPRDVPNITLPPRTSLVGDYVFDLPDDSQLTIGVID